MTKRVAITSELDNKEVYATYTMTLRDRNDNIIKQGKYEVHSAIRQYWLMLYNMLSSNGTGNYTNILGNTQTLTHLQLRAGGTTRTMGINVGTSSAAVQFNNTTMGARIAIGTAANQLVYNDNIIAYDAATGRATITRTFTNDNATTDPTVNEVGLCLADSAATDTGFVAIRDVPGSSYVVLFGATLTVSYEFQIPFGCQNMSMLLSRNQVARNTTNLELYDAGGTLVSSATYGIGSGGFGFVSGIGVQTQGIAVGAGDTATTFNTFAMQTPIAHGTGMDELLYYDSTVSSFELQTSTSNQAAFYLSRVFINRSAGAVTIKEIGLVSNATIGATNNTYLFDRRVLGSPISVDPDEQVTITWAFRYQFT